MALQTRERRNVVIMLRSMNSSLLVRHHCCLLLVAGLVFFTNLGAAALFDEDEPKNAVCGREMFQRGDWLVPTFNHELRTDKPILIYWMMLCSFKAFGVNEFAARMGSSVLAVVTSVFVYHLGRLLFRPEVGLWAGLVLCTCLMYAAVGRAVTPDSTLICCITGTFLAYVWAVHRRLGGWPTGTSPVEEQRAISTLPRWDEFAPATWQHALPIAVGMGLAVLAKGPVGAVLPTGILGLFLLLRQQLDFRQTTPAMNAVWWRRWPAEVAHTLHPLRIWRATLALQLPLVLGVAAVIALPWYLAVGWATEGEWLRGFLGGHNVGRFLKPMEHHSGPFFYYVPVILLGTFPWSVFLPLAIWRLVRELRERPAQSPALGFAACWAGVWIAFFSCASTKLPNYVLPSYPALALLMAWFLYGWQSSTSIEWTAAFRNCCRVLAGASLLLLVALPIALSLLLPSELWLAVLAVPSLVGAVVAYGSSLRGRRLQALRVLGAAAVCQAVLVVGIAPASVASHQDGPQFGSVIRRLFPGEEVHLATFDYFSPNLVFYADDRVHRIKRPQIAAFFDEYARGLLLTRSDRLDELQRDLPGDVEVLARERRFLRRHDLVLLGRPVQTVQQAGFAELQETDASSKRR